MMIKDLEAKKGFDSIELEIVSKDQPREWNNARGNGKVANAMGKDGSGDTVKVTLWNDDIEKVKEGDKVQIENGWVSEFQGEIQVSTGRFGKLTIA